MRAGRSRLRSVCVLTPEQRETTASAKTGRKGKRDKDGGDGGGEE